MARIEIKTRAPTLNLYFFNFQTGDRLNREWLHQTLANLGFKQTDIQVYAFLANNKAQTINQIAQSLNFSKQKARRIINNLRHKGCITIAIDRSNYYSAEPIEKILQTYADTKNKQADNLKKKKKDILEIWHEKIKRKQE